MGLVLYLTTKSSPNYDLIPSLQSLFVLKKTLENTWIKRDKHTYHLKQPWELLTLNNKSNTTKLTHNKAQKTWKDK